MADAKRGRRAGGAAKGAKRAKYAKYVASDRSGPTRTCIGCRQAVSPAELVRLVLEDGRPVADPQRRRPGRGASIHPRAACVEGALKKGCLPRAFRQPVMPGAPGELLQQVLAAFASSYGAMETGSRNHS